MHWEMAFASVSHRCSNKQTNGRPPGHKPMAPQMKYLQTQMPVMWYGL